jgi:hypothetical protein
MVCMNAICIDEWMGFSIGLPEIGEPFGSWLHFGIWVTDIKQYEGRDDTNKLVYVHSGVVNKEIGFHTIGNSTSLSAFGSILKIFFGGNRCR